MSDFQQPVPSELPPALRMPPPPPPPPPAPFGAPSAPQFGPYPRPDYATPGYPIPNASAQPKPPRPPVKAGSLMLIASAVGLVLGSVLTWLTVAGASFNGFSSEALNLDENSPNGGVYVFFAVLLAGFGITQLAARRVLAIAILAVVFASFAVLISLAELGDVSDAVSLLDLLGIESSWGPGMPLLVASSLLGLGGAIVSLSKRRR